MKHKQVLKIGILIPVYNEEKAIGRTIEKILPYQHDIVVVNDGSTDGTLARIRHYPVEIIHKKTNQGLTKAIKTGFSYMLEKKYDFVIKLDGDGQMDVSKIPQFIKNIKQYYSTDVFCATYSPDTPWAIRKDIKAYAMLYSMATGIYTRDIISEYRAYNQKAMRFILNAEGNHGYVSPFILIDMHRAGLRSREIKGGVLYNRQFIRPFPLEGLIALRFAFVTKIFSFKGWRSKLTTVVIFPFLMLWLLFNIIVFPKQNSFLTKKRIR